MSAPELTRRTDPELGTLDIELRCACGETCRPKLWHRWAPWTIMEIAGNLPHGWYLDGGRVACPEHADPELVRTQDRLFDLERRAREAERTELEALREADDRRRRW